MLKGNIMNIFEDVKVPGKYIVVFDFDEYSKIRLESTRTGRLISDIVAAILSWGLRKYHYTSATNATYV